MQSLRHNHQAKQSHEKVMTVAGNALAVTETEQDAVQTCLAEAALTDQHHLASKPATQAGRQPKRYSEAGLAGDVIALAADCRTHVLPVV